MIADIHTIRHRGKPYYYNLTPWGAVFTTRNGRHLANAWNVPAEVREQVAGAFVA